MTDNKQYPELPTHFMLVQESFRDEVYLYTSDQMRAYVDADRAMRDQARAALSTAAQPPAGIWVPTELAERVQETMGEFLMDHDWRQTDMDTADAFGALLAAAPKAAPAPDLELTDAQIFDIAADPATCPAPPWWHRDEVAAGDVRKAVLAFARAIIRASRGQAPAPAAVAPQNPPMPETWHVDVHVHGEKILSIGYDWLSGKGDLTESEEQAVVGMAQHLLSFVGYGLPQSGFDPDADEQAPAAQVDAEDAARYRYLKKYKTWDSTDVFYWLRCAPADEVDSIIDSARAAKEGGA